MDLGKKNPELRVFCLNPFFVCLVYFQFSEKQKIEKIYLVSGYAINNTTHSLNYRKRLQNKLKLSKWLKLLKP
jgi:hypothetical protein